ARARVVGGFQAAAGEHALAGEGDRLLPGAVAGGDDPAVAGGAGGGRRGHDRLGDRLAGGDRGAPGERRGGAEWPQRRRLGLVEGDGRAADVADLERGAVAVADGDLAEVDRERLERHLAGRGGGARQPDVDLATARVDHQVAEERADRRR